MSKEKQIEGIGYKRISKRAKAGAHPVVLHVECEAKCEPIFKRCEWCELENELLFRLADLEDKIENGTLVEKTHCKQSEIIKEFVKRFEYHLRNATFTLGQTNDIQYALKKATEEVKGGE